MKQVRRRKRHKTSNGMNEEALDVPWRCPAASCCPGGEKDVSTSSHAFKVSWTLSARLTERRTHRVVVVILQVDAGRGGVGAQTQQQQQPHGHLWALTAFCVRSVFTRLFVPETCGSRIYPPAAGHAPLIDPQPWSITAGTVYTTSAPPLPRSVCWLGGNKRAQGLKFP